MRGVSLFGRIISSFFFSFWLSLDDTFLGKIAMVIVVLSNFFSGTPTYNPKVCNLLPALFDFLARQVRFKDNFVLE